jgi:hypothetical protein
LITVKLADWLDEYRNLPTEEVIRRSAEAEDDWEEQDVFAAPDRMRSTNPRWLERAGRAGYGRPTGG